MKEIIKILKDVDVKKENAYLPTFVGLLKIDAINKETWWVTAGGRSWACSATTEVILQ